jgi:Putative MetA-pathway of phenol degradation
MTKLRAVILLSVSPGLVLSLLGQTCSQTSPTHKLICVLPQLFGPKPGCSTSPVGCQLGMVLQNPNHAAHFQQKSITTFSQPLTTSIGEELSSLPLGSGGAGISITYTPEHVPVPTEDSLGPIMTERAQVIGKQRITLGAAYQYFDFRSIDGISLHQAPDVLAHAEFPVNGSEPPYEKDYITNSNNLSLHLNQVVLYAVYGISSRIDVSAELPIETIHFSASSSDHIVRTVPCELANPVGTCSDSSSEFGEYHFFGIPTTYQEAHDDVNANFTNGGNASGIGDITLRAKGEVIKGEKSAASVGVAVRLPSGDATNLLGAGTVGVQPFGAFTYRGRVSPHVLIGYQWNGNSILPGNPVGILPGIGGSPSINPGPAKVSLPPSLVYSGGIDVRLADRVTFAADLIGQRLFSAGRLDMGTFTDVNGNTLPQLQPYTDDYSSDSIATGVKIRLVRELLLTGNITTRVDNGGLVARAVPLVGLSYAF